MDYHYQQMTCKKPVSHLDLKFLDLKFLTLDVRGQPARNRASHSKGNISTFSPPNFQGNTKVISMNSDTNDVTGMGDTRTLTGQPNRNTQNNSIADILDYVAVDAGDLYTDYEKRMVDKRSKSKEAFQAFESFRTNRNNMPKKQTQENRLKQQLARQNDALQLNMQDYYMKISSIERETSLIHREISKLYYQSNDLLTAGGEKQKTRQVKNIRLLEDANTEEDELGKDGRMRSVISTKNIAVGKDYIKDKINRMKNMAIDSGYENLPSPDSSLPTLKNITSNNIPLKNKQQSRLNSKTLGAKTLLGLHREQEKQKERYQRFYENLYEKDKTDEHSKRGLLRSLKKRPQFRDGEEQETLETLKKKMINNNFDKSFQNFLIDHKTRVPELLKKMR